MLCRSCVSRCLPSHRGPSRGAKREYATADIRCFRLFREVVEVIEEPNLVAPRVQERIDRFNRGLPTHDLEPGYYWVHTLPSGLEIAKWDGNLWHGFGWSGGNNHVDVLSYRLKMPETK
jgi:hypothetical protein